MKRAGLIVAALAVVLVGALGGMLYWAFTQNESEANKARTEPARRARWAAKEEENEEVKTTENITSV